MKHLAIALALALAPAPPATAISVVAEGDSIFESSPVTGVTKDPIRVLCDIVCPGAETCTVSGEYTNATASSPDAAGNGQQYLCASTGDIFRNVADSGDQIVVEMSRDYVAEVAIGKPVTGSSSGTCTVDTDCASGLVCRRNLGKCGFGYDVLVINGGQNDMRSGANAPGQIGANGESAAFTWADADAAGLMRIVDDACRLQRMRVVIVQTLVCGSGSGWDAGKQTQRTSFNTLISDFVAAGGRNGACAGLLWVVNSTPYVDTNADGNLDGSVGGDAIHPDTATSAALGTAIATEAATAFQ